MITALIDTSVWIEYFSKRSNISPENTEVLRELISNGEAVIIEPIRAELLSGHIASGQRQEIMLALDALDMIDLDWNARATWNDIVALAELAQSKRLPIPGIVDRMIILSALNANVSIYSRDRSLLRLGSEASVRVWP
jgi:predicted nucleic acid-binding protein